MNELFLSPTLVAGGLSATSDLKLLVPGSMGLNLQVPGSLGLRIMSPRKPQAAGLSLLFYSAPNRNLRLLHTVGMTERHDTIKKQKPVGLMTYYILKMTQHYTTGHNMINQNRKISIFFYCCCVSLQQPLLKPYILSTVYMYLPEPTTK